jgi:hypothetical protein
MARACLFAAELYAARNQPDEAARRVAWSCDHGSLRGCDRHGEALESAGRRDEAKAIYQDHCDRLMDEPMCNALVRLGGTIPPRVTPRPRDPQDD